jgi:hypothetical protein
MSAVTNCDIPFQSRRGAHQRVMLLSANPITPRRHPRPLANRRTRDDSGFNAYFALSGADLETRSAKPIEGVIY